MTLSCRAKRSICDAKDPGPGQRAGWEPRFFTTFRMTIALRMTLSACLGTQREWTRFVSVAARWRPRCSYKRMSAPFSFRKRYAHGGGARYRRDSERAGRSGHGSTFMSPNNSSNRTNSAGVITEGSSPPLAAMSKSPSSRGCVRSGDTFGSIRPRSMRPAVVLALPCSPCRTKIG